MMSIYLIRHGESHHNKYGMHKIGGKADDTELTIEGELQAVKLANRLNKENIKFDKIYSSTYIRANNTARIVSQIIGYPLEKIIKKNEFREFDHGDFNGKIRSEIYTPELRAYLEENSWEYTPPNGESQKMVAQRMYSALAGAIDENYDKNEKTEKNIAIFTHGTATRALLCQIMGFHPKYIFKTDIDNTSISEIKYDGKNFLIKRINDHAHIR